MIAVRNVVADFVVNGATLETFRSPPKIVSTAPDKTFTGRFSVKRSERDSRADDAEPCVNCAGLLVNVTKLEANTSETASGIRIDVSLASIDVVDVDELEDVEEDRVELKKLVFVEDKIVPRETYISAVVVKTFVMVPIKVMIPLLKAVAFAFETVLLVDVPLPPLPLSLPSLPILLFDRIMERSSTIRFT